MRLAERVLVGLLAVGCLMLSGIPLPGWVSDSWGSAAVAPARMVAGADARLSGRIGPVAGVWLPVCRTSDAPDADDVMLMDRTAGRIVPPGLPGDTLAARATQPMMTSARTDRLGAAAPEEHSANSVRELGRPRALVPLYLTMASLQTLDIVSTRRALGAGGSEANPMMAPMAGSAASLIAVKAGVSGLMIYAVERLWKQNRKAAILTMIGTNLGYGAIVAHNFGVAPNSAGPR
jgi:hypothetical protein